jgi:polyphosphate kinase
MAEWQRAIAILHRQWRAIEMRLADGARAASFLPAIPRGFGTARRPAAISLETSVGKKQHEAASPAESGADSQPRKEKYKKVLRALQIELVKLQNHVIKNNEKVLLLFEGRDAGGKDGMIKRIIAHLSPRETRVVALGKPSERETSAWYFQRYAPHLPYAQEIVLFNRSWYNRAGVERVMGFCTKIEYEAFIAQVPIFEQALIGSGVHLLKYYLDISRQEQKKRLKDRRTDPLKQWKLSPIDAAALDRWNDYTEARDEMLLRTSTAISPWHVVHADKKKPARLNVIRHILARLDYKKKDASLTEPDPSVVFEFQEAQLKNGMLAR